MTTDPVSASTQTPQTASQLSGAKLTKDLDSFITLLTTQLKHQDPLEPVDSTEFTSQLAQFAAVEQGIQTNTNLEKLIGLQNSNQALAAVGYLGKYVEALSGQTALAGGEASFGYTLPRQADAVLVQIRNEAGITVRTLSGETGAGKNYVNWNGKDASGQSLPDGTYTFTVAAADKQGHQIQTQNFTAGVAGSVEGNGADAQVTINGVSVPVANVVTVKTDASGAS